MASELKVAGYKMIGEIKRVKSSAMSAKMCIDRIADSGKVDTTLAVLLRRTTSHLFDIYNAIDEVGTIATVVEKHIEQQRVGAV